MSSCFGQYLKLSLFGQSHGNAIGVTLDGLPAGLALDMAQIRREMGRRAPGTNAFSTPRREADAPEILSGLRDNVTTGQPLTALILNTDARSQDYGGEMDLPRPGHADYTGHVRYYGFEDFRGGGHFSGRLTAPIVFAGAVCKQWLKQKGVHIYAHILQLMDVKEPSFVNGLPEEETLEGLSLMTLPVTTPLLESSMAQVILDARGRGDSVGGVIECAVTGLPAGIGAPFFDSCESVLSHLLFSIPAVKGVSFGLGFEAAGMYGSQVNDAFAFEKGRVQTVTNRCGGILGGVTDGMPVIFQCAVRPTPSISLPQDTVSLKTGEAARLEIKGRHDPCIVPRAVPVAEAMAAIGLCELWKERLSCPL